MWARPYRPSINPGHPLARGLIFDVPFLEGGGLSVMNLANGRRGNIVRFEPAIHAVEMSRDPNRGLRYASGGCEFFISGSGARKDTILWGPMAERAGRLPSTCFLIGNFKDVTSNQVAFQSGGHLGNSAVIDCQYRLQVSGGKAYTTRSNGISTDFVAGATTLATGTHALAATYDGATLTLYVDGRPDGSVASSASMAGGALGNVQVSGVNANANGDYAFQLQTFNDISVVRTWNRAMSPAEIQTVSADPWALYRPTRQTLFTAPVALAAGGQRGWLFPPVGLPLGLPVGVRA